MTNTVVPPFKGDTFQDSWWTLEILGSTKPYIHSGFFYVG